MVQIKSLAAITLISAGLALGIACGGIQEGIAPDYVRQYAECLADPAQPLHLAAGAETNAAVHEAGLRAELKSGEISMEEIRAAMELYCDAG